MGKDYRMEKVDSDYNYDGDQADVSKMKDRWQRDAHKAQMKRMLKQQSQLKKRTEEETYSFC